MIPDLIVFDYPDLLARFAEYVSPKSEYEFVYDDGRLRGLKLYSEELGGDDPWVTIPVKLNYTPQDLVGNVVADCGQLSMSESSLTLLVQRLVFVETGTGTELTLFEFSMPTGVPLSSGVTED